MAVVNYFGTQIPGIEEIYGQIKIESADLHGKDLTQSEDHFTITDVLLSENPVLPTVKDLQVEPYEEDVALSNTKIENWFTQQNTWLVVVLTASFIGVLSFVIGMIMVKEWFGVKNTVTIINTPVIKVAKQLARAISLLKINQRRRDCSCLGPLLFLIFINDIQINLINSDCI